MKISIVIPTYKKVDQLVTNVEHNMKYFEECEVIIVNDDPESSISVLNESFPSITIVQNPKNLGFAGAVNEGINTATGTHIFLLNNDVLLNDDSFKKALNHFDKDTSLFAVGFAQREKDNGLVGRNTIRWENGFIQHEKADSRETGPNAWAEGGASIFDKKKLIEVGPFDTIYSPFYWEDTDLGYRAWKHGYTILFDSSVIVEHHHESTISSFFSQNKVKTIAYRNQFFFVWTNISDAPLFNDHFSQLPFWIIRMVLKGEFSFIAGFYQALKQSDLVKKMRLEKKTKAKKTDKELLEFFNKV
jgi:GT2 family glycosyltransferase